MNVPRRVAVLIETDDSWGRDVVAAIAQAARKHQWQLLIAPRDQQNRLRLPRRWRGDGVLVSLRNQSTAAHVRRRGLPAVDVSLMMNQATWLGRVATDNTVRARMAFDHFRERQFEHFACYAPAIGRYSLDRIRRFQSVAEAAGFTCPVFAQRGQTVGWEVEHNQVVKWLSQLPRPLALFAADAFPARQIAEICVWNDISVPEEVAILAGDNDDLFCTVLTPQLSSIQLNCDRIGTEAAGLLQRLMNGAAIPSRPKLIPPLYVNERQSTNRMAVDDPEIAAILQFISERVRSPLTVEDIVRAFPISRRSLEQRFQQVLGRSPAEQIRAMKMSEVQNLLRDTQRSITEIALEIGFRSASALTQQFRRHFGVTPTAARAQLRRR